MHHRRQRSGLRVRCAGDNVTDSKTGTCAGRGGNCGDHLRIELPGAAIPRQESNIQVPDRWRIADDFIEPPTRLDHPASHRQRLAHLRIMQPPGAHNIDHDGTPVRTQQVVGYPSMYHTVSAEAKLKGLAGNSFHRLLEVGHHQVRELQMGFVAHQGTLSSAPVDPRIVPLAQIPRELPPRRSGSHRVRVQIRPHRGDDNSVGVPIRRLREVLLGVNH
jgi:hypothetical protein